MKQWLIVDKTTGKPIPASNHDTLEQCIYWFVEAEITNQKEVADPYPLWFEMSERENVVATEFELS